MTILAQDPSVRYGGGDGALAFASVELPAEILAHGPKGYRVRVVDYDASSGCLYKDEVRGRNDANDLADPFAQLPGESQTAYESRLLANPNFHCQNVYAIVMRTLSRFERALGRRVPWSFGGHQINVAPHAFSLANAFYSEQDEAIMFGYFPGRGGQPVFTCLSHDVVAHETTHALLDGIRTRYTEPSGPDQGAFHEAFADIVALLSILSVQELVAAALGAPSGARPPDGEMRPISADSVTEQALEDSTLFGLAEQFGREVRQVHGALRRSVIIAPSRDLLESPLYREEHVRGEILVAAVMRAFLRLWRGRILGLGTFADGRSYNLDRVAEEGAKAADHLLTMAIRALDYCPPTDMDFGAYLAALLTADAELVPEDEHGYRSTLREVFESYGIDLPDTGCDDEVGTWCRFEPERPLVYARTNFESMLHDRDEVFRFIWENRQALKISSRTPITVDSVRPSTRQGPDGFFLRETVVTYVQVADIFGSATESVLGTKRPEGMSSRDRIRAFGGGVLVFDQYGQVKYHIAHALDDGPRQLRRLEYLMNSGRLAPERGLRDRFAAMHRARAEM